jgi:hypothetical protein
MNIEEKKNTTVPSNTTDNLVVKEPFFFFSYAIYLFYDITIHKKTELNM